MLKQYISCIFCLLLLAVACKSNAPQETVEQTADDHMIKNQFIVKLKGRVDPKNVAAAYQRYGLTLKKAISQSMNMWVFTYDQSSLPPEEMLQTLQNSQFVETAEFDKKLQPRKRNN
ncbi:MAG: hypothetical protein AAF206_26250 [Bacteroidota bacterium]